VLDGLPRADARGIVEAVGSAAPQNGKLGLALSGGGFRAALFHVGVLARLAELRLLPQVSVLSTVSGGSVIGAYYYLRLLRELREHEALGDGDYVRIVHDIEEEFLERVQRNIRARTFLNLGKNVAMGLRRGYSRSDRTGDLLDLHFYKDALGGDRGKRRWGPFEFDKQIEMRELCDARLPKLVINATSLNSGHNWRFETTGMGESLPEDPEELEVVRDVDKNFRLAVGRYDEIVERQANFPIALAVAASAAVPTLFHPLAVSGLYDDPLRVELVDGGLHDNQGVQALFDHGCRHVIVSDASGQMADADLPATRIPGVGGRSMAIYGDRVRDEQLIRAYERQRARDGRLSLMHLRKGLTPQVLEPKRRDAKAEKSADPARKPDRTSDEFGVSPRVQRRLSRVRTDLDSFGDIESFSLMLDGYLMTDDVLGAKGHSPRTPGDWRFGVVAPLMAEPTEEYLALLDASKYRFFKPVHTLRWVKWFLVSAVVVFLVAAIAGYGGLPILDAAWSELRDLLTLNVPMWVVAAIVAVVVLYLVERPPLAPLRWLGRLLISVVVPLVFALPLFLVSLVLVSGNNLLYRRLQSVERLGLRSPPSRRHLPEVPSSAPT
jgi:NTE family protein